MPGLAHQQGAAHADLADTNTLDQGSDDASKRAATGMASDAAIRRMMQGDHKFADGGATTKAAPVPKPGDSGMVTADTKTQVDGKDVTIPKGTVVEVVKEDKTGLTVKVWGTFGGKQATIQAAEFKPEPALTHKEDPGHTQEPDDYSYQPYAGVLWNGTPKAGDVAQGYIGDCYLISAMGAVAAANPQAIMKLFSSTKPKQTSYTISLFLRDGKGGFSKHSVTVDTNLPSKLQGMQKESPVYGQLGKDLNDGQTPMWPALLEKAYAQLIGGYDQIGQGGYPERAMEAFTGVASTSEQVPQGDADVLAKFKEYQKAGKAVVCGTLDSKQATSKSGFEGASDGPYSMMLTNDTGDQVELVENSLSIYDQKNKAPRIHDDGNGGLTGGGVTGTVGYGWGATPNFTYPKDKGPAAAGDLQADYQWRGQLDKSLDVYANHAYMFESVTPDNKLIFKNPWGTDNPNPIAPADFKRLFIGIDANGVPKVPVTPPKKPAKNA
jgi:hypothetical protein